MDELTCHNWTGGCIVLFLGFVFAMGGPIAWLAFIVLALVVSVIYWTVVGIVALIRALTERK